MKRLLKHAVIKKTLIFFSVGMILGFLRGIIEAALLIRHYPLSMSGSCKAELYISCGILYGIVLAISGTILLSLISICSSKFSRIYYPLGYLIIIICLDTLGWRSASVDDWRRSLSATSTVSDKANCLLISIDTCRVDRLPMYGNYEGNTPFLSALSRRGCLSSQTVTSIPVTTPAHVSLFTGLVPPKHGSRFNAVPVEASHITLPQKLTDEGYYTGGFISAFPLTADVSGLHSGFSYYDQLLTPRYLHPLIYRTSVLRIFSGIGALRPAERSGWRTVESAVNWWRNQSGKPVFTFVHLYDPHAPYEPETLYYRMSGRSDKQTEISVYDIVRFNEGKPPSKAILDSALAAYDGEIASVDRMIEKLLRSYDALGLMDDSLVIVTGDHGESLGEHNYYFSHGDHLYDASLRIPFITVLPHKVPERSVLTEQITICDIMPTILGLLNTASIETSLDGRDLSEFIMGQSHFTKTWAYGETGAGIYTQAHIPPDSNIRKKMRSLRTPHEKVILNTQGNHIYYNLDEDPGENNPIHNDNSLKSTELSRMLEQYIRKVDPPNRHPPRLPELDTLEQLHSLGYIN
ncbi:sulfatase [bacterium]|nr:sulfatase [candidate division CSSED10-310 bacterium]